MIDRWQYSQLGKMVISTILLLLLNIVAALDVQGKWVDRVEKRPLSSKIEKLKNGDLLFYAQDNGNAITDVTQGFDCLAIDHVAIVHRTTKKLSTIEAISRGVVRFPIDSTLNRKRDGLHVYVGRICGSFDKKQSIIKALSYLNRPYDFYFEPTDSAIYCSELVQLSYIDEDGKSIFHTIPMSFHDRKGQITDYWKDFYSKAFKKVPEGKPGTNPGDISRNKRVKIIFQLF